MITSTISKRGQTTLPKEIQDALGAEPGQKLVYEIHEDSIRIKIHPGVMNSFGSLKKAGVPSKTTWAEARQAARDEWADHAEAEGLPK
jgi:bifunctional DNA-binding transcriptional regulator/antitoxin component of YhaV-PrlF toxin-antitoxin module